jgi:pyridoxine 4-dehydrogenase
MNATPSRPPAQITIGGDLTVNRIGYGAMHLTGPGMWGPVEDEDNAVAVLRRAVELGVNFIDTADCYGPGFNERLIRKALHPYPEDLVICTKGGLLRSGPTDWDHKGELYITPCGRPAYLRQQVELSLANLGVECIGLYQLHSIDPDVPLEDQFGALKELQLQGKIRHIGLSGQPFVTIEGLERAAAHADITAVENLFNITERTGEEVLRHIELQGGVFLPFFPLGHGGLVGPGSPLASVAAEYGATTAQLALAWLLHRSPATLLIPGTTSVAHLESNMHARELSFSETDMEAMTRAVDAALSDAWRNDLARARTFAP